MKKCISYFVVIYQSSNNTKYNTKILYMMTYFKKLQKANLKQAWLNYFFINLFGRLNKFMINNQFDK